MPTLKRFEELVVWQMAEAQCAHFQTLVEGQRFEQYPSLQQQMDRSSGSVMDNIAEGFDRFSRADFRHFLVIARGSNAEYRSQLYRCRRRSITDDAYFEQWKAANATLGSKLHNFIQYLSNTSYRQKSTTAVEEPLSPYNDTSPSGNNTIHNYPPEILE